MKRNFFAVCAMIIFLVILCSGCQLNGHGSDAVCQHTYESSVSEHATPLKEGTLLYACKNCSDRYTEAIPKTDAIKILAIGNSFSVDSATYLWDICAAAGIENAVVGIAQIGGSTLDTHWNNITQNAAAYEYTKYSSASYKLNQMTLLYALQDEPWDVIVIQQQSSRSGDPTTFGNLDNVLDFLFENKTNPDARILWNMTWAYPSDSGDGNFAIYGRDQMTMYQAIVSAVQEKILTNGRIDGVIPTGTAVQNLRGSYLGDNLCRDDLHLSHEYGRYMAAMTWFAYIVRGDVEQVDWFPSGMDSLAYDFPAIHEAVADAVDKPFEVSPCEAKRLPE